MSLKPKKVLSRRAVLKLRANPYPWRGIKGWASLIPGYNFERYLYILHRLTGWTLFGYLMAHVFVTSARIFGSEAWTATMAGLTGPIFRVGEFLIYFVFVFHGANGVRLILSELGITLGRPKRPVYPYTPVFKRILPSLLLVALIAAFFILIVYGVIDWFILGGAGG